MNAAADQLAEIVTKAFDNDHDMAVRVNHTARNVMREHSDRSLLTIEEELAVQLRLLAERLTRCGSVITTGLATALLTWGFDQVDWQALAVHYLEPHRR